MANDELYNRLHLLKYKNMGEPDKPKKLEIHVDGVKEVEDDCPFCDVPCEEPHCPYTEEK